MKHAIRRIGAMAGLHKEARAEIIFTERRGHTNLRRSIGDRLDFSRNDSRASAVFY
jgi:hypothetical protein